MIKKISTIKRQIREIVKIYYGGQNYVEIRSLIVRELTEIYSSFCECIENIEGMDKIVSAINNNAECIAESLIYDDMMEFLDATLNDSIQILDIIEELIGKLDYGM